MPATITGIVFADLNHNGVLDPGEPGIPNAYVVIYDTVNAVCTTVQTDASGVYTFSGLIQAGIHNIYETAVDPGVTCPPTTFGQPSGFTNSSTTRTEAIDVQQTDIDNNVTIFGRNYGHDNPELFSCIAVGYQVAVPQGQATSEFIEVNLVTGAPTTINNDIGVIANAIGYNVLDDMIYGTEIGTNNLIRIAQDGTVTNYGPITGLPNSTFVGAIDGLGHLIILNSNNIYIVDVDQNSPTFGQLLSGPLPLSQASNMADWAFNPVDGLLYGVNATTRQVNAIDPATGIVTPLVTTGIPPAPASGTYGAVFSDASGFIYAIQNTTGDVYRIESDGVNATALLFSKAIPTGQNDGASCQNAFLEIDFGDAPDIALGNGPGNYNTLLASNGPRHQIRNTLFLGTQVTSENDAWENPTATGDDLTHGIQDDGLTLPIAPILTCNSTYSLDFFVTNESGSDANLYVWIDFNQDGIFAEEEAAAPIVIQSNVNPSIVTATFNIPSTLNAGYTFIRARLTTDTLVNTNPNITTEDTRSVGPASDGEVEDYRVEIVDSTTLITPIKTADKTYVEPGDIINYTIVIPNTSAYDAYNLVLKDILPAGLSFVAGTFTVNGTVVEGVNLATGVPLGDLPAGEDFVISFNARVDSDTSLCGTTVRNQATVDIEICQGVTETLSTNAIDVNIECISMEVVKEADTNLIFVGDTVTYTITITNTGNVPLDNVVLTDEIAQCATFVEDSVTINGVTQPGLNPESGISIGTIDPGVSVVVGFSVKLDQICCPPSLSNKALVTYEYTLGQPPNEVIGTGSEESNFVVVPVAPTTFKQISRDETLKIPPQKPDIEDILNTLVDIEITNTRVIRTIASTSNEGQILTGFKLIVEGKLNQKIEYVACDTIQSVHAAHFKVPFSTYIILPADFVEGTEIEVEADIEDVYTKILNCRTVFKNVTFRLFAKQKR